MRRVLVVPYDPNWPTAFEQAATELRAAMGSRLVAVEHIGSTAVPGLCAKPIIDLLAIVDDLDALDSRSEAMRALGYEVLGEFGIPGRRYYRRDNRDGERTHHVHAFRCDASAVLRHLAFRDYLRAHPEVARTYADLKRALAGAHPDDIHAYMDGKDGFIQRVEAEALRWRRAGG